MTLLGYRPTAKQVALLGVVLLLAAAGGAWSEIVAQTDTESFSFRGRSLAAHWANFGDGGESEALVWVAEGVTHADGRQDSALAFFEATEWREESGGVFHVRASGGVDPAGVLMDRQLAFARLNTSLSALGKNWNAGEDWSNERPVTVSVIVDLLAAGEPTREDGVRRIYHPASGVESNWQVRGRLVSAAGSGAVFVDGNVFLKPNTATTWAELRNTIEGSVHMQKVSPGR